ncbi:MAG: hypothetical protein K2O15_01815 [Lachnospiraceae bacterium]|nr:hypothetical protein [Lachnospiraceae bacterium]
MEKKVWSLTVAMSFGLCMAVMHSQKQPVVRAEELSAKQPEVREIVSRGNMAYQDGEKGAGFYEEDFYLLWEKLSTISGEVFDPACYAHIIHADESGDGVEYDLEYEYVEEKFVTDELTETDEETEIVEEETETAEADEVTEILEEETETTEAEEVSEITGEEPEIMEPDAPSEITGEETETSGTEKQPEISVSGNDCPAGAVQDKAEEITEETIYE